MDVFFDAACFAERFVQGDVSKEISIVVVQWILPAFGDHTERCEIDDIGNVAFADDGCDIGAVFAYVELVKCELALELGFEPFVGEVAVVGLWRAADTDDVPAVFERLGDEAGSGEGVAAYYE